MSTDFSDKLLAWFDDHGRKHLPWQQNQTPYRVWLSEIMLQQTQVATVIPYYARFTERFPDVASLAASEEDEVLHLWTGLGYYARARNLRKTAIQLVQDHNGEFPADLTQLQNLPGIGRSTAGAIMALAFNLPATILDGNVKRVLTRCYAIEGWPGKTQVSNSLWEIAEQLSPEQRIADYTQAIMDLGATLCTRSKPDCPSCPMRQSCLAYRHDRVQELPGKKPKKNMPVRQIHMLVVTNAENEVLLQRRPSQGLWGGLWGFPECSEHDVEAQLDQLQIQAEPVSESATLMPFRHTFTHFHLDITPVHVESKSIDSHVTENDQTLWYHPETTKDIGLTGPVTKILNMRESAKKD